MKPTKKPSEFGGKPGLHQGVLTNEQKLTIPYREDAMDPNAKTGDE